MEDLVYGVGCEAEAAPASSSDAPKYSWLELLELFPERNDSYYKKLTEFITINYVYSRYSKKYSVLYSDFNLEIFPELFSHFRELDFFTLFKDVINYTLGYALRKTLTDNPEASEKQPYTRVRMCFECAALPEFTVPFNFNFVNLDQLTSEIIMCSLGGYLQSKREVVAKNRCDMSLIFI